jgi:methylenetetrahydrofolate reductase (NADPH)
MDTPSFSFELFPPRTPEAAAKLPSVIGQLASVRPDFFSVTHGAGGSDQDGTYETLLTVVEHAGLEVAPHLTCVGSTRAQIAALLQRYRNAGVKRIVALRGDLPSTATGPAAPGEFHYASQLVSFIRETHGDAFKSKWLLILRCTRKHAVPARTSIIFAAKLRRARTAR